VIADRVFPYHGFVFEKSLTWKKFPEMLICTNFLLTNLTADVKLVNMYWGRLLEKTIIKIEQTFPAIVITGPRQSGKSTLLKEFLAKKNPTVINLDDIEFRRLLQNSPIDYLRKIKKPVVIDEIQYFPELASSIKILIDEDRIPGQWFITGSQQFSVMKNISESLAGRAAILSLPTFQLNERKDKFDLGDYLLKSTYPEVVVNRKVLSEIWYSSYIQTYLERDLRQLMNVESLLDFERFLRLLAGLTSQELNYSKIASDIGISVPTVKRWITVLEQSYLVFLLPPYFKNFGKRIVKSPKLYFYDLGLVNYLVGIKDKEFLLNGPMAGAIFETAVMSEIIKKEYAKGFRPELYFWRSQSGIEIDLIKPDNSIYNPYEIKIANTIKPRFYKNLQYWIDMNNETNMTGFLITNCNKEVPLPENIENIYWKNI